ncbi:MAG: endonuclease/exonuclease/phosphatase family protein [Opitutales bacterium]
MAPIEFKKPARRTQFLLLGLLVFGTSACGMDERRGHGSSDAVASADKQAETFTVAAYNLENFFDLDGIALFDDYEQDYPEDPFGYSKEKLRTKLIHAVEVLQHIDGGRGPDIILFQEFENDFSPTQWGGDYQAFLQRYEAFRVTDMLGSGWDPAYADIPSVAWMLKAMADAGLTGYEVAVAPPKDLESRIAHVNAVFSRYPIESSEAYPIPQARDIQEVSVRVGDAKLWLYNNHWKSGASNPDREPIRVENAEVLRSLIDRRLEADPQADILVGGDLNSHYNHSMLFTGIRTGINDVLGSSGVETFAGNDLYNLWFELPPQERYSEVWRGHRGTLMHLLLSQGLYDQAGVSYVDSSFEKLLLPGVNADALGRPLSWHFAGRSGGGYSDHLPVYARFQTGGFVQEAPFSRGDDAPDYEIPLRYQDGADLDLPGGEALTGLSVDALAPYVGRLFRIHTEIVSTDPAEVRLADETWPVYVPDRQLYEAFRELGDDATVNLVARPGFWKGKRQFIVEGIEGNQ